MHMLADICCPPHTAGLTYFSRYAGAHKRYEARAAELFRDSDPASLIEYDAAKCWAEKAAGSVPFSAYTDLLRGSVPRRVTARGGFTVDETRMQITRDGEALPLTLTEYRILVLLLESKGVVSHDRLLQLLWDDGGKYIDDNTLSVHMSRLREKVGAAQIRTIRGVGYQWSDM